MDDDKLNRKRVLVPHYGQASEEPETFTFDVNELDSPYDINDSNNYDENTKILAAYKFANEALGIEINDDDLEAMRMNSGYAPGTSPRLEYAVAMREEDLDPLARVELARLRASQRNISPKDLALLIKYNGQERVEDASPDIGALADSFCNAHFDDVHGLNQLQVVESRNPSYGDSRVNSDTEAEEYLNSIGVDSEVDTVHVVKPNGPLDDEGMTSQANNEAEQFIYGLEAKQRIQDADEQRRQEQHLTFMRTHFRDASLPQKPKRSLWSRLLNR